jgi:ABC-type transport system substrate-binding protein
LGAGSREDDGGGEPIDPVFTYGMNNTGDNLQWNLYHPQRIPKQRIQELEWGVLANWHDGEAKYIPDVAEDWTVNPEQGKATIHLRKNLNWWDGTPVTARDVITQWEIDRFVTAGGNLGIGGAGQWDYIEDVQIADENTIEASITDVNPEVFIQQAMDNLTWVKHDLFKQHLESFKDATSDSERKAERKKLLERTIDEPFGYGMWKLSVEGKKLVGEKHDGHYASDGINDYKWEFVNEGSNEGQNLQRQMILSDKVDGLQSIAAPTKDFVNKIPDKMNPRIVRNPTYYGRGIEINCRRKPYDDRRVRKALNYLVDHTKTHTTGLYAGSIRPTRFTGISQHVIDKYIPKSVQEKLTDYTERNEEKAFSLLREAGLTRKNGNWYTADGKLFAPTIKVTQERIELAQLIAGNLSESGIKTEVKTVKPSLLWSKILANHDYELGLAGWGAWSNHHPFGIMRSNLHSGSGFYAQFTRPPQKPKIPMPVGDENGSKETIDIRAKVKQLGLAQGEKQNKIVQELAWTYNQLLPQLPGSEYYSVSLLTGDDWKLPPENDPDLRIVTPAHWLPRFGKLNAKTK